LCAIQVTSAQGASVTLMWDRNLEPDIAGYRLYYGTASQTYTQQIDVGTSTVATASNLPIGSPRFFVTKAYNTAGIESMPSDEVTYTAPLQTPTATPTPSATPTPTSTPTPSPSPSPTSTPPPSPTP